jgi:hypothetical protein
MGEVPPLVGVAVKATLVPAQIVVAEAEMLILAVVRALITRLDVLLDPTVEGLVPITLILYPVPEVVPLGITALIVPFVMLVTDPMDVGEVKLPLASDS